MTTLATGINPAIRSGPALHQTRRLATVGSAVPDLSDCGLKASSSGAGGFPLLESPLLFIATAPFNRQRAQVQQPER